MDLKSKSKKKGSKQSKQQQYSLENENDSNSDSSSYMSEQFDDKKERVDEYDDDLMGDLEDRLKLKQMPQLMMEQILADRFQKRQQLIEKRKLQFELMKREKKNKLKGSKKDALSHLEMKRKLQQIDKQQNQQKKKNQLFEEEDENFLLDEEDGNKKEKENKFESKGNDMDEESEGSSDRDDDDNSEFNGDDQNLTYEDLQFITLQRKDLENFCGQPYFEKEMIGFFVRIPYQTENTYLIAEIIKINTLPEKYKIENKFTDKVLRLKHGRKEKNFKISHVSNKPIKEMEFQSWLATLKKNQLQAPTKNYVKIKKAQLLKTVNKTYTAEEKELFQKHNLYTKIDKIDQNSYEVKDFRVEINQIQQILINLDYSIKEATVNENEMRKLLQEKEQNEKRLVKVEKLQMNYKVEMEKKQFLNRNVTEQITQQQIFGNIHGQYAKSKLYSEKRKQELNKLIDLANSKYILTPFDLKFQDCKNAEDYQKTIEESLELFQNRKFDFDSQIDSLQVNEEQYEFQYS